MAAYILHTDSCPQCQSMNLSLSRLRGWWERWVLARLKILPLRCMECKTRFYSSRRPLY